MNSALKGFVLSACALCANSGAAGSSRTDYVAVMNGLCTVTDDGNRVPVFQGNILVIPDRGSDLPHFAVLVLKGENTVVQDRGYSPAIEQDMTKIAENLVRQSHLECRRNHDHSPPLNNGGAKKLDI
jgi:hypothetical protein